MMAQNTSTAVMARRRSPPRALDYFPTPPWATRALLEYVNIRAGVIIQGEGMVPWESLTAWEPACGEGHMANVLAERFGRVVASDVFDYGIGAPVYDFLGAGDIAAASPPVERPDFIITNPPFSVGQAFVEHALEIATHGVAMLVRTAFLESADRYDLFKTHPPSCVAQFSGRVSMVMGRLDPAASSATAYCWIVWRPPVLKWARDKYGHAGIVAPHLLWIPPDARARLERPGDYPTSNEGGLL